MYLESWNRSDSRACPGVWYWFYMDKNIQRCTVLIFILAEKVTLITQTEAPDSNATDDQAKEVSFFVFDEK